jgi:hypothetical protein
MTTALGNAVAGSFIRTGSSPTLAQVDTFLEEYSEHV